MSRSVSSVDGRKPEEWGQVAERSLQGVTACERDPHSQSSLN